MFINSGFYKNLYNSIIINANNRKKDKDTYYENHHIIPSSIGGSNNKENIVALTAREHFICHYLLIKITIDINDRKKMIWAFHMMCVEPKKGYVNRKKSSNYELARKLFIDNHPTKSPHIVEKIRNSTLNYYKSDKYIKQRKETVKNTLCMCGCNTNIEYHSSITPKFVNQKHYFNYLNSNIKPKVSDETRIKQSITATKRLQALTGEEKRIRMYNSALLCDHKKRGMSISKSKKGKQTNQQQIMGMKYASMSDDEFKIFLCNKKRTSNIIARMSKLREKYLGRN